MKKFLTALAILACTGSLALAGPNAGGTILVHYAPVPVPPEPVFVDGGLTACAAAVTEAPTIDPVMWFAYAAFPTCASPRLKVVTFGCTFDPALTAIMWYATQPGATQIFYPDQASWPYTGSGVAVGFLDALTATVDEIYCFAGYSYGDAFCLVPHPDPVIGGTFADDNNPSNLDMIAGYGCLGFGVPGHAACPEELPLGACCYPDQHCEFVCEPQCAGTFLGGGVPCDPNPCLLPGACCLVTGECVMLTQPDCEGQGGLFIGGECTPTTCPTPTETTSWGQIKNIYR